uniref:Uncharacterized protein n=1 Tax=Anguilla anguilla TaxID=7936 RepID=A0A0E9XWN3_ANGAN
MRSSIGLTHLHFSCSAFSRRGSDVQQKS